MSSYYADDGQVVLRAQAGNSSTPLQTETAPLRVYFDRRTLKLDAYMARIRVHASSNEPANASSERTEMVAWFEEPESSHFDQQVLRQRWQSPSADRLRLEQVLNDEVLRSRLSAGLAGPPPQLEWLLADRPMQKLFKSRSQFEWLSPAAIDNTELQRIQVTSEREQFVFWIEPHTSLIWRVELPLSDLPTSNLNTDHWSLSLELHGATFQPSSSGENETTTYEVGPGFQAKWVRAFVPLPPRPPAETLGRSFPLDYLGQAGVNGDLGEFLIIAQPPAERDAWPVWLQTWQQFLPTVVSPQLGNTQLIFVTSDRELVRTLRDWPTASVSIVSTSSIEKLLRQLRLADDATVLLKTSGPDPAAGKVLLSESGTNTSTLANIVAVIRDSMAGVDVPARIHADYEAIVREYESRVKQQLVD